MSEPANTSMAASRRAVKREMEDIESENHGTIETQRRSNAEKAAFEAGERRLGNLTTEMLVALNGAMKLMENARKSGDNTYDRYKYSTLEDFLGATRGPCLEHGLILYSRVIGDPRYSERGTKKGGVEIVARVLVETRVIHAESGGWLAVQVWGEGQDRSDKAVYKALTGARKYSIAMLFGIYTTDDPEHDPRTRQPQPQQHDRQVGREPISRQRTSPPAAPPSPPAIAPWSEPELSVLFGKIESLSSTQDETAAEKVKGALSYIAGNDRLRSVPGHIDRLLESVMDRCAALSAEQSLDTDEQAEIVQIIAGLKGTALTTGDKIATPPAETHGTTTVNL